MSTLDSMSIRGIRSFSDEAEELITFAKPLNIIVGANGCGKTTIIECLKYATTGELPPGVGMGASFVHDPKMAGKAEVKGQIKIKFKNRIPQTMVCIRDIAVTQARTKISFKALDSVLMTYKTNEDGSKEKVSISHRCTDMDRMMPDLLGVSKPVLQHVIFCHQEESNWPLGDASTLKKRFDDIFEATRYTKALADIKELRKEKAAKLKELESQQAIVATEVNRVRVLTDSIDNNETLMEGYHTEIADANAKIAACTESANEVQTFLATYQDLNRRIETHKNSLKVHKESWAALRREVSMFKPSERSNMESMMKMTLRDAQLALQRLEAETNEHANSEEDLRRRISALKSEAAALRAQAMERQGSMLAKHAAIRQAHEFMSEFDKIAQSSSMEFEFSVVYRGPYTLQATVPLFKELSSVKQSTAEMIKTKKYERDDAGRTLQSDIDKLLEAFQLAKFTVENNQTERTKTERQIASVQTRIRELEDSRAHLQRDSSTTALMPLQRKLEDLRHEIAHAAKSDDTASFEKKAKELSNQRQQMQRRRELAAQMQQDFKRHEALEAEAKAKQQEAARIFDANRDDLLSLLGKLPASTRACDEVQRKITALQQTVDDSEREEAALLRETHDRQKEVELAQQTADLCTTRADEHFKRIQEKQARLTTLRSTPDFPHDTEGLLSVIVNSAAGEQVISAETLRKSIRSIAQQVEDQKDRAEKLEHFGPAFRALHADLTRMKEKAAATSICCPCCARTFSGEKELLEAMAHMEERVKQAEGKRLLAIHRVWREALQILEGLEERVVEYHKNKNAAADAQLKVEIASTTAAEQAYELEQMKLASAAAKSRLATGLQINTAIALMDASLSQGKRLQQEADQLSASLQTKQRELAPFSTPEECIAEENRLYEALKVLQEQQVEAERKRTERSRAELSLVAEINSVEASATKRQTVLAELERANTELAQLQEHLQAVSRETTAKQREISAKEEQIAEAKASLQRSVNTFNKEINALQERLDRLENTQNKLTDIRDKLARITHEFDLLPDLAAVTKMQKNSESIADNTSITQREGELDKQIMKLEQELVVVRENNDRIAAQRITVSTLRRHITLTEEINACETSIASLQQELTDICGPDMDANPEQILRDLEAQKHAAEMQRAELTGRMRELKIQIDTSKRELQTDALRTAERRADDIMIQVHTNELAVKDLDLYYNALDVALMRFHRLKISEINGIIRELWTHTYAGSDIDTIEIRSDLDDNPAQAGEATTTATGRLRSYNYRVVMLKGGVELDMRGRCSAGQKVLASLVIRLALAESFCVNTGILALDEPTTNLDAPNRRGLAHALARLIELRAESASLQLLVITHDEEFVGEISRATGGPSAPHQIGTYYRVWREEVRPGVFRSRINKMVMD